MKLEANLIDKFLQRYLLGKRQISRPLKARWRHISRQRDIADVVMNPKTKFQHLLSRAVFFLEPYYAYFCFPHTMQCAKEAGMTFHDMTSIQFWKEPYIYFYLYTQYFHPKTLDDRLDNVHFYRQPNRLFKGTQVPDWAQNHTRDENEFDNHSQKIWEDMVDDFQSEISPVPFVRDSGVIDSNPFMLPQFFGFGDGNGRRLFYNEKPVHNTWYDGGNFEPEEMFYGYNKQNKKRHQFDTTTEEGKAKFDEFVKKNYQMYPDLFPKETTLYPHQVLNHFGTTDLWKDRNIQNVRELRLMESAERLQDEGKINESQYLHIIQFIRQGHFREFYQVQQMILSKDELGIGNDELWTGLETLLTELKLFFLPQTNTSKPELQQFWEYADYILGVSERDADFNAIWQQEYGVNSVKLTGKTKQECVEVLKSLGLQADQRDMEEVSDQIDEQSRQLEEKYAKIIEEYKSIDNYASQNDRRSIQ